MTKYVEIVFQTDTQAFATDHDLGVALLQAIQLPITIERANYDDGTWSGWYGLKSDQADLKNTAMLLQGFPGLTTVMLKTNTGAVESPEPATPHFATGAQFTPPAKPQP